MPNVLRYLDLRRSDHFSSLSVSIVFILAAAIAASCILLGTVSAQKSPEHMNPAVAKLAHGQPMIGIETADMSLQNCRHLARIDFDYVYVDYEHSAMDLGQLAYCTAVIFGDTQAVLKKGNTSPKVAIFARFPPFGRDQESNDWVIKQALDMGLMGIIFNGVDNAQQMTRIIQEMRYPWQKKYKQPAGLRGYKPDYAAPTWGLSPDEYERHADVWPLNPEGDLLAIPMIETAEGLKNVNEIAAVPGVGAIFAASGGDLHEYLNVPQNSPVVEEARQKILAACKAHNVPCGISENKKADAEKRIKEGWRMIRTAEGVGLSTE